METLPNDWDEIQRGLGASVLQSRVWADVQESMGRKAHFEWSNHWSWVGFERSARGIRYLLVPYGPTATLKTDEALKSLVDYAKSHNFDFIRLEPRGSFKSEELRHFGAQKVAEFDPEYTQVVDLTKTEAELRSGLNSGHRNRINGADKRGIDVTITASADDFESFLAMINDTAKRAKVTFHPDQYYKDVYRVMEPRGVAKLYIAKVGGKPITASLFYDYNGMRYYSHSGAFQELNRKYNATVYLLWRAMLDAKASGLSQIDLWGVAPNDDPKHKWAGLTAFKKGFGGSTVRFLGTYDIPLNNTKYRIYKTISKLRGRS